MKKRALVIRLPESRPANADGSDIHLDEDDKISGREDGHVSEIVYAARASIGRPPFG